MTFIDIKTNKKVTIIKEVNATTVRVKRATDGVEYNVPKNELRKQSR